MNVVAYLKDIDGEITGHRQEIAKHQLRIAQLQDMRVLMMHREEERATATGQPSPFGALPDGATIVMRDPLSYQPYLAAAALAGPPPEAVVHGLTEEEKAERKRERNRLKEQTPKRIAYKRDYNRRKAEERRAVLAKYGQHGLPDEPATHPGGRKVRADKGTPKPRPPKTGRHTELTELTERVKRIFLDHPVTPLMSREVIDLAYPGRVSSKGEKQDVYVAMYRLKRAGFLAQSQPFEPYTLVQP